jgi:uncharacterized repeat protein (TIGR02543 family)
MWMMRRTIHLSRQVRWAALLVLSCLPAAAQAEDPVHFNDANLKAAVEAALGKPDPTPSDMRALVSFTVNNKGISDLTGLEYATGLTYLWMTNNLIDNLSPLAGLTNLTWIDLTDNRISDLSPMAGFTDLQTLVLNDNQIGDLSALAGLTRLCTVWLQNNQISDLSGLANLTHLTTLYLGENLIHDVSPLANLINLKTLSLQANRVGDLSALEGLCDVSMLNLSLNQISEIPSLAYLMDLSLLNLNENQISDISPLQGLKRLVWLYLQGNPLDGQACDVFIPQIRLNNPGVMIQHDPCIYRDTLTLSSTTGGSVTEPGEGDFVYDRGTTVPIVATADQGWHFAGWTGTAVDAERIADPSSANVTIVMDHDCTLRAHFVSNEHTLTISRTGGGRIEMVIVFGGISTTLTGEGAFVLGHNSQVTITATPDAECRFVGWSGSIASADRVQVITLTEDLSLTASFIRNARTLTVTCGAGGKVVQPGIGSFDFERGSKAPVEAAADTGYRFDGWTGTAVDKGYVTNPAKSATEVTLTDDCTLHANFVQVTRQFLESWKTAALGAHTPSNSTSLDADEGPWALGDGVSSSGACGSTPNRAEILALDSGQALRLSSVDAGRTCSEAVWVALDESAPADEGPLVIDVNTVISFNEVGHLNSPTPNISGKNCEDPPCFDNVSLLLTDNRGNRLAYVLQRPADVNALAGDTYREVFLDRSGVSYQRSLFTDFRTIPAFNTADARISTIEFRVAEHGSAIIDEIAIGPGAVDGRIPVYHFWSPTLETHFFTIWPEEKQYLIDTWESVWTFQGISYFTLPEGSDPNLAPVYRFWSPTLSSHFYTVTESERDSLVANYPTIWILEGVAFYVFAEGRQPTDAAPVYRLWSPSLGCHFYTADTKERDELAQNYSDTWMLEGIAWYAYPPQWDSRQALEIIRNN